ncbi:MAG: hypothetical protein HOV80_03280, partial [Polyangiaceae bacterium]|nr:hypothetical protein [Polyangiaceae bacterium]
NVTAAPVQVEVKVTVRAEDIDLAGERFELAADGAEERDIYFFDTPALELFDDGVILRARNVHDDVDDTTVKIRPLSAASVARSWFKKSGFKCEIDQTSTKSVESCSYTLEQGEDEIDDAAKGERAIEKLFTSEQEDFLAKYAPSGPVDWSELRMLGPVAASVWKLEPEKLGTKMTVELWTLPNGERVLEVSARAPQEDADELTEDLEAYVSELGLVADPNGTTKTRTVLEYFASAY